MICLNNFRTTIVRKSRKSPNEYEVATIMFEILILLTYFVFSLPLKSSNEISPRDNEHDVLRSYIDYVIFINEFVMSRVCIHLTWTLKYEQYKFRNVLGRKPKQFLRCY